MAVEYTHPGTPPVNDPQVEDAMKVYDRLNDGERRELFRTLYRSVTAYGRSQDIDHLVRFAQSVDRMVRLEATHPEARQALREAAGRQTPIDPRAGISLEEAVKQLRE